MPTGIEYLRNPDGSKGETWNPITGCTPISEGCANCWAKDQAERMKRMGCKKYDYPDPFAVRFHPDELDKPLHWRKPRRVGVSFMGDLFHSVRGWHGHIFKTMMQCPRHTFFLLTKRHKNMREAWNLYELEKHA